MFNWIQHRLNRRHVSKKQDLVSSANLYKQPEPLKEEFIDWHKGLLTIGTIGNDNVISHLQENSSCSQDHSQDLTLEEVLGKLQNETLNVCLHEHVGPSSAGESEESPDISLDKFPNYSTLRAENTSNSCTYSEDSNKDGGHVQQGKSVVFSRGKDICSDNGKRAIGKKSFSFLVKKMIACTGGFAPAASLRDPVSESRMEKILRAILHKKIYPQSSSTTLRTKKYLENRGRQPKSAKEDHIDEKPENGSKWVKTDIECKLPENGSKWVKTDSEYIVLEI